MTKHPAAFLRMYGMKYASVNLLLGMLGFLSWINHGALPSHDPTAVKQTVKTWLALGDSYTIGESVAAKDRFPAQTAALLKAKGIMVAPPRYIARTGWTTEELQDAIDKSHLTPTYDLVTVLIGVNDQYRGLDSGGYRLRFTQLLGKAIQLAGGNKAHVFVLSIPDYGVTPFGGGAVSISHEIDGFNRINREITAKMHVAYVDITPVSRKAATDPGFTANDGLHPSPAQYAAWSELLAVSIESAFK